MISSWQILNGTMELTMINGTIWFLTSFQVGLTSLVKYQDPLLQTITKTFSRDNGKMAIMKLKRLAVVDSVFKMVYNIKTVVISLETFLLTKQN